MAGCNVYIANRPEYQFADTGQKVYPLRQGEIYAIGQACGNGWRKVFNVYAKLLYALPSEYFTFKGSYSSWQQFRDEKLLQKGSDTALLFCEPKVQQSDRLHIVMGRTYAKSLNLANTLQWINQEFAVDTYNNIIVCPYFDYRQLSNRKIIFLVELIVEHFAKK